MGREVKRVRLDFDWPMGVIWPGFMHGVCSEDIEYVFTNRRKLNLDEKCEECHHAARLAGLPILKYGCPQWKIAPLIGEGWQMWETTTEGSPMSPVFATPEELARWLADTGASAFGSQTASYEDWLAMIKAGWAPSAAMIPEKKVMMSGVEFMAQTEKKKS